ncbi:tagaturonate reductase [Priestia filamentosa]|uniref:tagaturonate reductase n=1 Tax=Priestia filamentosa TaxID=1402861 RepID=UPI003D268CCC
MKLSRKNAESHSVQAENVLQFGEGVFLRGFVDWQIQKMNEKGHFNGRVVAVNPRRTGNAPKLNEQDGLFTVSLQGLQHGEIVKTSSIVSCVRRGVHPYKQYDEYIKIAENENLRFVISNTTEAGIAFREEDKLDDQPQESFPGKVAAFLYHRYQFFKGDKTKGLIFLPCELLDQNGEKLKSLLLRYAEKWNLEKEFSTWIQGANTFCSTLVDRIVPGYSEEEAGRIQEEEGYEDDFLVVAEPFYQWVIEAPSFVREEFPAEKAMLNVKFVDDITPYSLQKVRILNGLHTAMMPIAYLAGCNTVREAISSHHIGIFIQALAYDEIIPVLSVSKEEASAFAEAVLERFQNPFIRHDLLSISLNSLTKFKARNLPTLREYVEKYRKVPKLLSFSLGALFVFYKGKRGEEKIPLSDQKELIELFQSLWEKSNSEKGIQHLVSTVLSLEEHWGEDLSKIPGLAHAVESAILQIEEAGMENALKKLFHLSTT